jgi:HSP20 family molecular chaperone IbpA
MLRKNAVAAPEQGGADSGFERFMQDTFRSLVPGVYDMQEDDHSWTLTVDVPGVAKNQLRVNVVGNTVNIETDKQARRQVRATYQLPDEVDVEKSEAKLEDGVLTLKLGKVASATARQIRIS